VGRTVFEQLKVKPRCTPPRSRWLGTIPGLALHFVALGLGVSVQGSGFRIQDSGFRIQDSGFRIQDSGDVWAVSARRAGEERVNEKVSGCRGQRAGVRNKVPGFRVHLYGPRSGDQGSGFILKGSELVGTDTDTDNRHRQ